MLSRLLRVVWYTAAGLIIVLALLLSTARLVLPLLDDFHDELQGWVTLRLGQPVEIERLDLGWYRFGPDLRLLDTTLYGPEGERKLLELGELRIGIDLWRSWRQGRLVSSRVGLYDTTLNLIRQADGRIILRGYQQSVPLEDPLAVLFGQPRIEVEDVDLLWEDRPLGIAELRFNDLELTLRNRGQRHRLELAAMPEANMGRELELVADLVAPDTDPSRWNGRLYVNAEGWVLREWLQSLLVEDWEIGGVMDASVWLSLEQGRLRRATGRLALALPVFTHAREPVPIFTATELETHIGWHRLDNAWQLSLDELKVQRHAGRDWPASGVTLVMEQREAASRRMQLGAENIPIEMLLPFLPLVEMDSERKQAVYALDPRGQLRRLQVAAQRSGETGWSGLRFKAEVDDLAWQTHGRIPALSGLSLEISGSPERGRADLAVTAGELHAPALFRSSIALDQMQAELHWERTAKRWRLSSPRLRVSNADLAAHGRLRLELPGAGGSPFLDLQMDIDRARAASTPTYLPAGIMPEKTVAWLDRAIVSGEVKYGGVLFQGRLADFPFEAGEGRMEIRAQVVDGILNYHPDWHRIEEIDAELVFINRRMTLHAIAGSILGTRLSEVEVSIADLRRARLAIDGEVDGPLQDMLRFVQESPLAKRGYPIQALQGSGRAELDLALDIPLRRGQMHRTQVDGRLALSDNGLYLKPWDIRLADIDGSLDFTQDGLRASGIRTRLWDAPVTLNIQPHPADDTVTRVDLRGELPVVEQVFADAPITRHIQGRSTWEIELDIGKQIDGYQLTLTSDLAGVAIDLPAPLGKAAAVERPFRFTTHLDQAGLGTCYIGFGRHSAALDLDVSADRVRLRRAGLAFNKGPATLPDRPGIVAEGELEAISVDAWRKHLDAAPGAAGIPPLRSVKLEVGEVEAFGQRFASVDFHLQRATDDWAVRVESPDIAGQVNIPLNGAEQQPAVVANLDHLKLQGLDDAATGPGTELDPARLPPMQLSIESLEYAGRTLGQTELRTETIPDGLRVTNLSVEADWLQLTAQGNWTQPDGREASRFDIEIKGGELGKMLTAFGYSGNVEGGETTAEISANWPGSPVDFELPRVEGTLSLRIGAGQLMKLEPGAGRVFGLLNLYALPRRLALDFSDLFKRGFAFDRIEGSFTLIDSDAYTQDLVIVGPSARIDISGRIGLEARDYDQLVTVTPEVTSGLPLAGALAGGPAVGAALFLADRLLGDQVQDITRYQYSVTGSWEDPEFTRLEKDQTPAGDKEAEKEGETATGGNVDQ